MGQKAGKAVFKVSRKAGDPMNVRNLPAVHTEIIYPSSKRTMNYAICRCWQSGKFPICDNSHKMLQWQGCDCGPVMLEVRQAPSLTPVGAEWSPSEGTSSSSSSSQGGPTAITVFGGAASVSALLADGPLLAQSPSAPLLARPLDAPSTDVTTTKNSRCMAPLRAAPLGGFAPCIGYKPLGSIHPISREQDHLSLSQSRAYANMSEGWAFKKVQYTKYRIAKPWTLDTQFDDIILSEPSKDSFAKFTKEAPLFLRFLKLITDVEKRPRAFIDFAKRYVKLTHLAPHHYILWVLPPARHYHSYPLEMLGAELAVLFDLPEEDCYKYCIRQRAKTPEKLVEIKYEKPKNLVRPCSVYSCAFDGGESRNIREFLWKEERALTQSAKDQKDAGEELLYRQMKKYASDARCLECLSSFKGEVQQQLAEYHSAVVEELRQRLVEKVTSKLAAIQQAERAIEGSLQEVIVRETVESFQNQFAADSKQQDAALKLAIQSIAGDAPSMDPAGAHFLASLKDLGNANLEKAAAKADGSVIERVAAVFQRREQEFLEAFTVSSQEAGEVKQLLKNCKSGDEYDFSKLSDEQAKRLDALQETILNRVGFATITENDIRPLEAMNPANIPLVEQANTQLAVAKARIRAARLTSFARSFA
ncbi:hypothetical protein Emed_002761 [Eimeria media]